MLYGFVIAIHVVSCIILIGVILLQAGRGGGLSETFGGEASQTIFGTKVSVFLTKATIVAAALYLVTCLSLGIMTTRRGRSLIDLKGRKTVPVRIPQALPLGGSQGAPREREGTPLAEPEKLPTE
ncbi:MAG: preprotein translocase subunit SecG [Omnitrophica bacterium]|nr:preprotein translocase subunit SecG [Candidatus Omnitrophota bacterium]